MSVRDSLLASLVALIWGVNFVVIDWGMHGVPPLLFLALRFTVVLAVLPFVPRPDVPWRTLAAIGLLLSLGQFGFLYASIHAGLSAGLAALVLQAQVLFTVVLAAAVLGETPGRIRLLGIALGSAGLVVVGAGRGGETPLLALLLCLAGALSWGIGNVVTRAAGVRGGLGLTVWSSVVVPLPALALSLLLDGPNAVADGLAAFGWQGALSTLYTAILASLVGYGVFTTLLGRNPASAVVPWILLVPPVAMVAAWLCLGDVPRTAELAGAGMLLAGAFVASTSRTPGTRTATAGPTITNDHEGPVAIDS